MKIVNFSGEIENAYGKKLASILNYDASVDLFENIGEVRAANEYPSDSDVVKFLNQVRKTNARAKAMQAALDAAGIIKPTLENDEQLRLQKMYEILVASKKTHEEARALASTTVGVEWADGK